MPCQTQTSQHPQQPTTVLPQNLPKTQADWQRFLQRMNELLGSINNAQYATGVNAVPTEYAVYDGTALPALRITGATSAFDTAHAQFGVGSLKLTATASTVTVELAASGYPITLHPNWKWIASLFLLTSAANITGKLSVVTPAQQYDVDISGSPGASWSRLYGDYDLTADASTSCTLLLTLTGVTIGQVFNVEGWMLEPSQGAVLPSPFIMTSGPRTWNQVVGSDAVNTNITTAQTTATTAQSTATTANTTANTANTTANTANTTANTANTTANNAQPAAIVNPGFDHGMYGWTPESDASNWYAETGTNGPNAGTTTYMVHRGSSTTTFLRNSFRAPVVPGQIIKATCKVNGLSSPTGTPAIRILFQDINNTDIAGSPVTSGAVGNGVQQLSVVGTAPSNAAYATISPGVGYGTGGYYTFDDMAWNYQPSSVDEVPNGQSYIRSPASSWAPEVVQNANFLSPADPQGNIPGWSPNNSAISIVPAGGPKALQIVISSTGVGGAFESNAHACQAGDMVSATVTCDLTAQNNGAYPRLQIQCFNASGGQLTPLGSYDVQVNNATNTLQSASCLAQMPAGAASFRVFVYASAGPSFTFLLLNPRISVNDLRVANSGARVGNQANLPQRTITNYPSKVSPSVSYSASAGSPATATISVAAFTALLGSVSVSYNAASASVTGTNGTNVGYYLYFNDPSYSGGTHTLVATTNQNDLYSGDGYVYVGYVTVAYPSSGSGNGGGTGCPLRTAWVIRRGRHGRPQHVRAGKVRVGDWLLRTDGEWTEVTFSRAELQPCVRLVADGFGTLGCSVSAPMQLRDGSALSIACLAREVVVSRNGTRGHAVVTDLHDIGDQWVQHITLANAPDDFFWTGDAKDALFGHHNAKPP